MSNNSSVEIIRATIPIALTIAGVLIGIVAFVAPSVSDSVRISGLGASGACFAGAAGLSQPSTKRGTTNVSSDIDSVNNIEQPKF